MSRFAGRGLDQVWFIFFVVSIIIPSPSYQTDILPFNTDAYRMPRPPPSDLKRT